MSARHRDFTSESNILIRNDKNTIHAEGRNIITESGKNVTQNRNCSSKHQRQKVFARASNQEISVQASTNKLLMKDVDIREVDMKRSLNDLLGSYCPREQFNLADKLLGTMIKQSQCHKPNLYQYNTLLDAYIKCGHPDAGDRAEFILDNIRDLSKQLANEGIKIDTKLVTLSHNKVLTFWKNSKSADALNRVKLILHKMEEENIVNHISYTVFIGLLANQCDMIAASRAEAIARYMLKSYQEQGKISLKPNSQTWNSVINAWVRCGNATRAEAILYQMEEFESQGHSDMEPNVISYSTVMDGWAKSKDEASITKVEEIFHRLCTVQKNKVGVKQNDKTGPNMWTSVMLIDAYTKQTNDKNALLKAEDTVRRMYEAYKKDNNNVKPNTQLVTMVIDAWKKSGAYSSGEKAEALLDWLISVYHESKDIDLAPNEHSFSATIDAWAKSQKFGKAVKAKNVLDKMIRFHKESGLECARPNNVCYTAVINSCAYTCEYSDDSVLDKRNALKIAVSTYKALHKQSLFQPNSASYINMLTALRNLLPPSTERDAAVKVVFRDACEGGYVDNKVMQRLQSVLDSFALQDITGITFSASGEVRFDKVPHEWRRNT